MNELFIHDLATQQHIVYIASKITIFFLFVAILLFIFVSMMKIYLEKSRSIISAKKSKYIQIINMIYFGKNDIIKVDSGYDYEALAQAIGEINNFYSLEDRWIIHNIIEQTKLDVYLLNKYRKSFLKFQKKYFLSQLANLIYPPLKNFFLAQMHKKDDFIKKYALFGFAALSQTSIDLNNIFLSMKKATHSNFGSKFYEFIFEQVFKQTNPNDIYTFVSKLTINDNFIAKSIMCTIGNIREKKLYVSAQKIYKLFSKNDEIIIHFIRVTRKLRIKNCNLIKENYLSRNDHVRAVCADNAFALCDKEALDFLYIYFFDKNEKVRSNIINSSKQIGLKPQDVLRIIDKKTKNINIDKFAIYTIESW